MSGVVGNVTFTGGHDGSIDVTTSGGTSPYSYLWNDGATTEDRSGLGQRDHEHVLVGLPVGRPVTASSVMTAPLWGGVSMPPLAIAAIRWNTSSGMSAALAIPMPIV